MFEWKQSLEAVRQILPWWASWGSLVIVAPILFAAVILSFRGAGAFLAGPYDTRRAKAVFIAGLPLGAGLIAFFFYTGPLAVVPKLLLAVILCGVLWPALFFLSWKDRDPISNLSPLPRGRFWAAILMFLYLPLILMGLGPFLLSRQAAAPVKESRALIASLAFDGRAPEWRVYENFQSLAMIAFNQGDFEKASTFYRVCAALAPDSIHNPVIAAGLLTQLGRCAEASEAYAEIERRLRDKEKKAGLDADLLDADRALVRALEKSVRNCSS